MTPPDDPASMAPPDGRRELAHLVRGLRLRLEDAGRAGLAAVPAPAQPPGALAPGALAPGAPAPGAPAPDRGHGDLPVAARRAAPAPRPGAPTPEARTAEAVKGQLETARRAAEHVRAASAASGALDFQDTFDFGAPDLEAGASREEALARVAAEVAVCERCPELVRSRTRTVPGQGSPRAALVFVGEGPGEEEDRQGLAFVGRAGQLLTKMIESIGLARDEVFIANIVKCRPPANRAPTPIEAANCRPYLMRQLEVLRPKVIVALGGVAAQNLLETHEGITRLRGRFYPWHGSKVMPTFHPAYLLRNYTPDTRRKVYEDLLKVKAELGA
jgi:DNA polymerase